MSEPIRVGDWSFSPDTASLTRSGERRRLEHRAALVLELLCRRQGAPITPRELVDAVWNGRALSQNSVAVVIADLRRALDDDSRRPRYIETIPKRGYRLMSPVTAADAPAFPDAAAIAPGRHPRRARFLMAALAMLAVMFVGALILANGRAPAPFTVAIAPIPNETGNPAFDPLALAVTDLVGAEIGAVPGVRVMRGPDARVDARIGGRLVLWNRQVSLSLAAEDPQTREVTWSIMAAGPASQLPRQIHAGAAAFGDQLDRRRNGPR